MKNNNHHSQRKVQPNGNCVDEYAVKKLLTRRHKLDNLNIRYQNDPNFHHLRYQVRMVEGDGNLKPTIMFICESPSILDEQRGKPMSGPVGVILDALLRSVDLKREHIYITYLLKYRTLGGRDPREDEIKNSISYLREELSILQPKIVVPLGRFALGITLPDTTMAQSHGQATQINGRLVIPMFNPEIVIHNPQLRSLLIADMRKVGELV